MTFISNDPPVNSFISDDPPVNSFISNDPEIEKEKKSWLDAMWSEKELA
jgi:hypothetical protein